MSFLPTLISCLQRPQWVDPIASGATVAGVSVDTVPGGRPIGTSVNSGSQFVWPTETDLIYVPGTMKVMLTLQSPLIRTVLQDGIENLRASLLVEHAFPEPSLQVLFIRKNLIGAARSHLPRANNMHRRLLVDDAYLDKLSRLVSNSPSNMIDLITSLATRSHSPYASGG
jgi:hypothetical protein